MRWQGRAGESSARGARGMVEVGGGCGGVRGVVPGRGFEAGADDGLGFVAYVLGGFCCGGGELGRTL